jgi:hypothetical protein
MLGVCKLNVEAGAGNTKNLLCDMVIQSGQSHFDVDLLLNDFFFSFFSTLCLPYAGRRLFDDCSEPVFSGFFRIVHIETKI